MAGPRGDNQFSDKQIEKAYWFAKRRPLFRKIGISILGGVASLFVLLFIIQLFNWLTHIQQTSDILTNISVPQVNYDAVSAPEEILINTAQSVKHDDSSVDVVFGLKNVNTTWGARVVEYEVFVGSQSAGQEQVSLAPGQEKFLTKSRIPASGGVPPQVTVAILDTTWERIKRVDLLPDVQWAFDNADFSYIRSSDDNVVFQSELSLTVRNQSVYGFRAPEVVVVMHDGNGAIQGVGSLQIDAIGSLESRDLTFRWPERLPTSSQPTVYVNVDVLDENAIISE